MVSVMPRHSSTVQHNKLRSYDGIRAMPIDMPTRHTMCQDRHHATQVGRTKARSVKTSKSSSLRLGGRSFQKAARISYDTWADLLVKPVLPIGLAEVNTSSSRNYTLTPLVAKAARPQFTVAAGRGRTRSGTKESAISVAGTSNT